MKTLLRLRRKISPKKSLLKSKVVPSSSDSPATSLDFTEEATEGADLTLTNSKECIQEVASSAASASASSPISKKNLVVRFSPEPDTSHEPDEQDGQIHPSTTWYAPTEINRFRADYHSHGRAAQRTAWAANLTKTYSSLARITSAHDMNLLYAASLQAMSKYHHNTSKSSRSSSGEDDDDDAAAVGDLHGLENYVVDAKETTREAVYVVVDRHYATTSPDHGRRQKADAVKALRKASHAASRPSRLYALHVGQLHAAAAGVGA